MSRNSIVIWISGVFILVLLYLLSSTDLLIKDEIKPIYQISIILKNADDDLYSNFKKGVEKAAGEFNVDTNIIDASKIEDIEKDKLIYTEKNEGANAIVIENSEKELLKEESKDFPFVVIGDEKYNFWHSSLVYSYKELSLDLAKRIEDEHNNIKNIYFMCYDRDTYENNEIYNSIKEYFDEAIIHIIDNKDDEGAFRESLEDLVIKNDKEYKPLIIAADKYSLSSVTKILSASTVYTDKILAVYGFGNTTYILNKLDENLISGIEAFNDYEIGYLSIKTAVDMIKRDINSIEKDIDSEYIDKNSLKNDDKMKFLYPIE